MIYLIDPQDLTTLQVLCPKKCGMKPLYAVII